MTGPGPHPSDVAVAIPIATLSQGQSCAVRLVPDTSRKGLQWVQATQSFGVFLYTWRSGTKTYNHLLMSTNHPAYAQDMAKADEAAARHHRALQLYLYSGLRFEMLMQLARNVATYEQGLLALGLSAWLVDHEPNLAAATERAERLTLMRNSSRLTNLADFGPAAALRTGDALARITRGAYTILASKRK